MVEKVLRLPVAQQLDLITDIRSLVQEAPLFYKHMPRTGTRFNYTCTSAGLYGWYSDKARGYRYENQHPATHQPFPPIPKSVLEIIDDVKLLTEEPDFRPETCLVNVYGPTSTLGIHKDDTEVATTPMVVSISLGAPMDFYWCPFYLGRNGTKKVIRIESGDVLVLAKEDRMCWHGVPFPPHPTTGPPELRLQPGIRVNLTIRQVQW